MNADVVVKTLDLDTLGRDTDKVFTEAQVLRQLDHPAIIRIWECGYVDAASKTRPHIIMDYFQGETLESYVNEHGPLSVEDLLPVARQVAEGLRAAHKAKILHRDVKPANLLVRREATGWKVKIIDFGLAMPQKTVRTSKKASTSKQNQTMIGSSVAGTLDYSAPEQIGRRQEPVGFYSDVYGWAKTCCYALFQTPQPLMRHWKSVPERLACLLEKCLDEDPEQRPANFAEVLKGLGMKEREVTRSGHAPIPPQQSFYFESPENVALAASEASPTIQKTKKNLVLWILGGVGLVLVAIALVLVFQGPGLVKHEGKQSAEIALSAKPSKTKLQQFKGPELAKNEGKKSAEITSSAKPPKAEIKEEPVGEIRRFEGNTSIVWDVALSPNNKLVASAGNDGSIHIWDVSTGQKLKADIVAKGVRAVAFSPDGKRLLSADHDKVVRWWDVSTGKESWRFSGDTSGIRSIAFFPGGNQVLLSGIVLGKGQGKVAVWDAASGKEIKRFLDQSKATEQAVLSPDGRLALSCGWDNTARCWNIKTGKEIQCFRNHREPVLSVAFFPDGRLAASASLDHTVRVWEVSSGRELKRFDGLAAGMICVAVSPDGSRILAGGGRVGPTMAIADNTVHLWDVDTRKELCRLEGHQDAVWHVAFTSDGKYAVSCSWDKTVRLWRLPKGESNAKSKAAADDPPNGKPDRNER